MLFIILLSFGKLLTGVSKAWVGNSSNLPNEIKFASGDTITGGGWWREIDRITTSKNWTVPDGITRIGVFLLEGGSSGYSNDTTSEGIARGGYPGWGLSVILNPNKGQIYKAVIGEGGVSDSTFTPGGNTIFGDYIAHGGGLFENSSISSQYYDISEINETITAPYGGIDTIISNGSGNWISGASNNNKNIFDTNMKLFGCGGP